ncbi:MAG TPA: ATP-binding protein [Moheibacter sp.]|nr:ATP-binding protein [Moheibacter sp.]
MRTFTIKDLYQKSFLTLPLTGVWFDVFGEPERSGKMWLVYGAEKNGKTWFCVMLAYYLSKSEKVLYISAEQGMDKSFLDTCQRVGIPESSKNFQMYGYVSIEKLKKRLSKRYAPKIIFIDNITVYNDELRAKELDALMKEHHDKLFIFIAHEERGEPYTATAKRISKLADRICRVQGLVCTIGGRTEGNVFVIDEEKAQLIHGTELK